MPPLRDTDKPDAPGGVHIVRAIPLPWIIGVIGAGIIQAALWWFQMQQQGATIIELKAQNSQILLTLAEINKQLSSTNLKDLEHDLKITSLTNRIAALEALYPRQIPPLPAQR